MPFAQLLFPVSTGTVSSVVGKNLPAGMDSSGNAITLDLTQKIVNNGLEAVDVAAGSFPNAMKQTTTISGAAKDVALSQSIAISGTDTRWYAPNVGLIRESIALTVDTSSTSSDAQLRGYIVDGVQHGISPTFTALGGLSPLNPGVAPPEVQPALATDGSEILVLGGTVTGTESNFAMGWSAARVRTDGAVLGTTTLAAAVPYGGGGSGPAPVTAAAYDGTHFLVIYYLNSGTIGDPPSFVAQLVSTDGDLVGSPHTIAAGSILSPCLAYDGTRYLLAFQRGDPISGGMSINGVFISPSTGQATGAEFTISSGPGQQLNPRVASDGSNFLVLWDQGQFETQPSGIVAARVNDDGSMPDAGGFMFHPAELPFAPLHNPALIFDGSNYVVLWRDERLQQSQTQNNLFIGRVSPAGALLDSATDGVPVTTAPNFIETRPTLALFNGKVLAIWQSDGGGTPQYDIRRAQIDTSGPTINVLTPGTSGVELLPAGYQQSLAMVSMGSGVLLAWFNEVAPAKANSVDAVGVFPFGP